MVVLTSFVSFTSFPLAKNFATIILFATIFLAASLGLFHDNFPFNIIPVVTSASTCLEHPKTQDTGTKRPQKLESSLVGSS